MYFLLLLILIIIGIVIWNISTINEPFDLSHFFRRNWESGAAMLRGDLPITPVRQSWFNTRFSYPDLTPGYF